MNIDERLERLTERHEALAQSIELLLADNREMAAENRKRDERMGQLTERMVSGSPEGLFQGRAEPTGSTAQFFRVSHRASRGTQNTLVSM